MKSLTRKSTYDLVVQSEDKSGSLIETLIYGLLILSVIFGMWQFAAETMTAPRTAQINNSGIVQRS